MIDPKTLTPADLYRLQSDTWVQGAEYERERIIKIIREESLDCVFGYELECKCNDCDLIAVIEREQK